MKVTPSLPSTSSEIVVTTLDVPSVEVTSMASVVLASSGGVPWMRPVVASMESQAGSAAPPRSTAEWATGPDMPPSAGMSTEISGMCIVSVPLTGSPIDTTRIGSPSSSRSLDSRSASEKVSVPSSVTLNASPAASGFSRWASMLTTMTPGSAETAPLTSIAV
ncbi:hypothetical protein D9M68_799790 [compost metagenome]